MSMIGLGISEADEQLYRSLLRRPGGSADPAAVARLAILGLVKTGDDGTVTAIDPQTAVDRLIHRRLNEVNSQLSQITAARSTVPSLLAEQLAQDRIELVERIEGWEHAQRRIWQTTQHAGEVLAVHRSGIRGSADMLERMLRFLEQGRVFRTIVLRESLADPETLSYLRQIHQAGDRHRVTDEDVQPLIIADRATAFVAIEPGRTRPGALMISQPGIVTYLVDLFEQVWSRATDLMPAADGPTEAELEVLALLDRFGKDEAAARTMGVSVRTFRSRVAQLMARLGAANRFQAGARAKAKGWI